MLKNIEFFKWLFDKDDIEIESTIDLSLCSTCSDANIYYPKELGNFFRTSPMKRINRILQLGEFINNDSNTYHTRFEHCMGTYNKKKNIILSLYENTSFRNYVEKNKKKNYLIAELIKSAGHDIGHLPLSHIIEISVIKKREFHEVIGKRILLENPEIRLCLDAISPQLHKALKDVLEHDIFGFSSIDEGNYDIDRFDYIVRDLFYRGKEQQLQFEPFCLTKININGEEKTVPVFDISSVPSIIEFLKLRQTTYKESYFHPINQIRDASVAITLNELIAKNDPNAQRLQNFIKSLQNCSDTSQLDLKEYLYWDDLTFYNELLDVAQYSSDFALRELSTFVLPHIEALMNMVFTMLDLRNTPSSDISSEDKKIIHRIHYLINSNEEFAQNIKDPDKFNKFVLYTTNPQEIQSLKKNPIANSSINFHTQTLYTYKSSTPIYIKNTDGNIYEIDKLPDTPFPLSSSPEYIPVAFVLPVISQSPRIQQLLTEKCNIQSLFTSFVKKPNLAPVQTGHSMQRYFSVDR